MLHRRDAVQAREVHAMCSAADTLNNLIHQKSANQIGNKLKNNFRLQHAPTMALSG